MVAVGGRALAIGKSAQATEVVGVGVTQVSHGRVGVVNASELTVEVITVADGGVAPGDVFGKSSTGESARVGFVSVGVFASVGKQLFLDAASHVTVPKGGLPFGVPPTEQQKRGEGILPLFSGRRVFATDGTRRFSQIC